MNRKAQIKVVILDDHPLIRQGIRNLLEADDAFLVVGEGGSGEELEKLIQVKRPDIILLDIEMPQHRGEIVRNGAESFRALPAIERLQAHYPSMQVLIVSQHLDRSIVEAIMDSGARGYLLKDDALSQQLAMAVKLVHAGGLFVSEDVRRALMTNVEHAHSDILTRRQLDTLQAMIIHANAPKTDLAEYLGVTESTVRNHMREVRQRLGVHTTSAAIIKGIQMGLASLDHVSFDEDESGV